jgi:hopanoid biosynthesis associated protein HpnK
MGFKLKRLIVTADDFGFSSEVNRAVIQAHREGILVCASLMVTAPAAQEAIKLAREHSTLKVGLHLVLVNGFSILTKKEIPDLVNAAQRFSEGPTASGFRYFLSKRAKRQVVQESEAQIETFLATGLKMDHLNSHHHLHIHPTLTNTFVALAEKYHIPAIRLPLQGLRTLTWKKALMAAAMLPWAINLRHKLRKSGIAHNQEIFGLYETGAMSEETWLRLIPKLMPGTTEIFCHPAVNRLTRPEEPKCTNQHVEEFKALLSPKVRNRLISEKVELASFSDIAG